MRDVKKISLFLDSGAHSLYTREVIDKGHKGGYQFFETDVFWKYVDDYAKFVKENKDIVDTYVNVDVIFNPELTWKVHKYLQKEHGLNPLPVVHYGTDLKWLKRYMDECEYIGLGGLGQEVTGPRYVPWADRVFDLLCDFSDRLPRWKIHGFAMTSLSLMLRYPWWSVDSVSGESLLLVREAGRIRVLSIEELYYSSLSKRRKTSYGHFFKDLVDVQVFVPDSFGIGGWVKAEAVVRHDTMKSRYKVKTSRGRFLEMTGDHGIFKKIDKKAVCVPTLELNEGDFVVGVDYREPFGDRKDITIDVYRKFYLRGNGKRTASIKSFPIRVVLDDLFMEFIGLWVADGSYSASGNNSGVTVSVANDPECKDVVEKIATRWASSFGISPNKVDITIRSSFLSRLVQGLGIGRGSHNKEVPWWVFEMSESKIGSFLRGYFSGDGTMVGGVECTSVSQRLIYGLFSLLTKMGIDVLISGSNNLRIGGVDNLKTFQNKIGFLQEYKNNKLRKAIVTPSEVRGIREVKKENEIYLKCKKVEKLGVVRGPVYDLVVPEGQRFVANGLLVHNSTSWVMTSRMGSVYVPRFKSGQWIYDENSWKVCVSFRSPSQQEAGQHFNTFSPEVQKVIVTYFEEKGYKIGQSEFRIESKSYKLKVNERWHGKASEGKREVELTLEEGLSNSYKKRDELNIIYFLDLEKSMPEWPWPFKKQRSGFGLL